MRPGNKAPRRTDADRRGIVLPARPDGQPIHAGIPVDEMEERINASGRTQLLTGFALNAATRTTWQGKLRTLGRSLASGLLAEDDSQIDTEQMIIAAVTDIEGPQLALRCPEDGAHD